MGDVMIIRKLSFLSPQKDLKKVELNIYEEKNLSLIYVENQGYVVYTKDNINDMENVFLLKSILTPKELTLEEYIDEKADISNIIELLLNKIYENSEIKEYEKQHPDHVLLHLLDILNNEKLENITKESPIYKTIEDGFMKLDFELIKNKTNS